MRVDWSPDGSALLAVVNGTLRRGDEILDGPDVLDARWREDGSIVAVDRWHRLRRYGDEVIELLPPSEPRLIDARIADDHYLGRDSAGLFISSFSGAVQWRNHKHDLRSDVGASIEIAGTAKLIAFAYESSALPDDVRRTEGRGWQVIDVGKNRVTDRRWVSTERVPFRTQLAFDAAGRRIAIALPEPGPSIGAIRVGKSDHYPNDHLGGARAVALDDRGILAAYAYPRSIEAAPRRLRVDYLEPGVKPETQIAITETLWIDPDVDDIVALAFDRASRKIACLDASGTIDVVPVP